MSDDSVRIMEDFLNQVLSDVSRQHEALENECRLLRDLLKPWPRKKMPAEDIENKERKATPEAQVPSENLSYAERQVDELLRKAEKARHLKPKIKGDADERLRLESCIIKNTDITNNISQSSSCIVNSSSVDNKYVDIKTNKYKTIPTSVPSSQAESSSKQAGEIQSSQPAKNLPKRNVIIAENSCSTTKERSKESKHENLRPHSHKTNHGRTHHVPVHMLAPFKTNNTIRFPKRKNNHLPEYSSSARVPAKTPLSAGTKTYKTLPEIAPRDSKRPAQTSDTCKYSVTQNNDSKSGSVKDISSISLCNNNNKNVTEGNGPTDYLSSNISPADANPNGSSASDLKATVDRASEYLSISTQSTERGQSSQNVADVQSSLQETELERFTLQKYGSSMKLPNKLIKLVNTNQSLREKLSTAKLTKKVSMVLPAQQFVERLCAEDDIGKELRTRVSALTCLRSHQILMDTLQDLHLGQLSESTSTEELYRAKKTVEFVLTVFSELQEEADYLSQVKFRHIAPAPDIRGRYMDQQVTLWLDTGQKKDFQDGCLEHLQTSKHWNHLRFTEKCLQLNVSLVKAVHAEWWKVLVEDRDLSVFQGVYGLLTSHGQFLPALVQNPV